MWLRIQKELGRPLELSLLCLLIAWFNRIGLYGYLGDVSDARSNILSAVQIAFLAAEKFDRTASRYRISRILSPCSRRAR